MYIFDQRSNGDAVFVSATVQNVAAYKKVLNYQCAWSYDYIWTGSGRWTNTSNQITTITISTDSRYTLSTG